jgi:hypothetical protein
MFTKSNPSIRILAGLVLAAGLAGCAYPDADPGHRGHHAGASDASPSQGGMMGGNMAAGPGGMRPMDKDAMCTMYRNMQNAPTDEQRHEMMERNMQNMSPEMRQRHMEMMQKQCQ